MEIVFFYVNETDIDFRIDIYFYNKYTVRAIFKDTYYHYVTFFKVSKNIYLFSIIIADKMVTQEMKTCRYCYSICGTE